MNEYLKLQKHKLYRTESGRLIRIINHNMGPWQQTEMDFNKFPIIGRWYNDDEDYQYDDDEYYQYYQYADDVYYQYDYDGKFCGFYDYDGENEIILRTPNDPIHEYDLLQFSISLQKGMELENAQGQKVLVHDIINPHTFNEIAIFQCIVFINDKEIKLINIPYDGRISRDTITKYDIIGLWEDRYKEVLSDKNTEIHNRILKIKNEIKSSLVDIAEFEERIFNERLKVRDLNKELEEYGKYH